MSGYNQDFDDDASCDLIGIGLDIKVYACRWLVNGVACHTEIPGRDYSTHLRTVHGVGRDPRLECKWDHCGEHLKKDCVIRHLQEKHLMYRWPCPKCGALFTRRGNMNAHRANCTATG
ncbi:hypothetical protein BS17DRAFT_134707 [Gyrodon lividus]|nr:hypothetical protein BS17DRAFT_134707 [Gyrodon lividus]